MILFSMHLIGMHVFQLRTRFAIVICYFLLLFFCFRATELNHFSRNEKT